MRTWIATQTRQLPVLSAALPMDRFESAIYQCSKPEGHNGGAGRWLR